MKRYEVTVGDDTLVVSSPTIKTMIEKGVIERIANQVQLTPTQIELASNFLTFIVFTSDNSGLNESIRNAMDSGRNANSQSEFLDAMSAFYDALDDNYELFVDWLNAINKIRFGEDVNANPDETEDEKKSASKQKKQK